MRGKAAKGAAAGEAGAGENAAFQKNAVYSGKYFTEPWTNRAKMMYNVKQGIKRDGEGKNGRKESSQRSQGAHEEGFQS